ncbi:hypothetical protein PF005_g4354 [Phytophthora fragariae]|uniref:Uncharacterized protein n=2 Tax=Phytophthora TaxID=4783 RepID=A0A6A4A7G9_9STRA|nr:hypothetical protein PF003_g4908 [Phytophthora fragariae]KAE9044464.1 hypothetical protein PR002_g2777 [Phytophthora rubi]KAE8945537.1 hypothetical protein PF009_g4815 [Phytophthora fragariae]KAE9024459.1 hypothetical protein PF011_g3497 [Phytophthora fragariae]KAE9050239.1 hypothetical protein PR001_g2577 [Phytophthora rubi]
MSACIICVVYHCAVLLACSAFNFNRLHFFAAAANDRQTPPASIHSQRTKQKAVERASAASVG